MSAGISHKEKDKERADIESDVEKFLKNGGKIEQVPYGETGYDFMTVDFGKGHPKKNEDS